MAGDAALELGDLRLGRMDRLQIGGSGPPAGALLQMPAITGDEGAKRPQPLLHSRLIVELHRHRLSPTSRPREEMPNSIGNPLAGSPSGHCSSACPVLPISPSDGFRLVPECPAELPECRAV